MNEAVFAALVNKRLIELSGALQQMNTSHRRLLLLREAHPEHYFLAIHAAALATHVQEIYTQTESLLKFVLEITDGGLEKTGSWHSDLLAQANVVVPGVRAALLTK